MVRPRFQREPPPLPEIGVDWCAFAVKSIIPDDGPYFDQKDETMDSIRHEELTLFYRSTATMANQLQTS